MNRNAIRRSALGMVAAVLLLGPSVSPAVSGQEPEKSPQPSIATQVDAVLLDLIVRDDNGHPVRDLQPDEIRVLEDGVEQTITGFRSRSDSVVDREIQQDRPSPAEKKREEPVDPFGNLHLVSLVFDRLSLYGRQFARQGAIDFLESEIDENTLVSVFVIDFRLHLIQPYTRDVSSLEAAVKRVTSGEFSRFGAELGGGTSEQPGAGGGSSSGEGGGPARGRGSSGSGAGIGAAENALSSMESNMVQKSEELLREQLGSATVTSLMALVGEQRRVSGRKTVLFFSEGVHAPPNLLERFNYTISEANRANVTIYAVDARGLRTGSQMEGAGGMLGRAVGATRDQLLFGVGKAVTREQVMAMENAETSLRLNLEAGLAALSEGTGGFLISNTNDVRPSLRRLQEDLQIYYEASYTPTNRAYDGSYRQIRVEVLRPHTTVQTRNGYFAVPALGDGPPVYPYEVPMLAALSSRPAPREFDFRGKVLRFDPADGYYNCSLVIEAALRNFTFQTDASAATYSTRFSLMAMIENEEGRIVRKISQDYPLEGPIDKVESLKQSDIVLVRQLILEPGRYRLGLAAYDRESNRSSVHRSYLYVPSSQGSLGVSSLSIIGRVDPAKPSEDETNPFVVEAGKIVPNLTGRVQKRTDTNLSLFLVIYPSKGVLIEPGLTLQLLQGGNVIGQATLDLPEADEKGQIPYIATLPISDLAGGDYEVRAVVSQAEESAVEHCFFTLDASED
jgi:VWFA-related protein